MKFNPGDGPLSAARQSLKRKQTASILGSFLQNRPMIEDLVKQSIITGL